MSADTTASATNSTVAQDDSHEPGQRPTQKLLQYWKTALATLAAVGTILICVYVPPAAIYLSPAVEFLVGYLGFAGMWAGLTAFVSVVTALAGLAFAAMRISLDVVESMMNGCCSGPEGNSDDSLDDKHQIPTGPTGGGLNGVGAASLSPVGGSGPLFPPSSASAAPRPSAVASEEAPSGAGPKL